MTWWKRPASSNSCMPFVAAYSFCNFCSSMMIGRKKLEDVSCKWKLDAVFA
jgi:hypothetical protein